MKGKTKESSWERFVRQQQEQKEYERRIQADFERLVEEERIKHGHYEENEIGPICP